MVLLLGRFSGNAVNFPYLPWIWPRGYTLGAKELPGDTRYCSGVTSVDTDARARTAQLEALRRLGGPARVEQVLSMSEGARQISIAGLVGRGRARSPGEARAIVLRRILGDELYEAAYGNRSR